VSGVPIIVIAGTTASGKTAAAVRLARLLDGEIVGADSIQVYHRLDIGSAKPTRDELDGVPHHMLDRVNIDQPYDAGRYMREADEAIAGIRARGRVPIVAGGTGMYLRALVRGLAAGLPRDAGLRAELNARAAVSAQELARMHAELAESDPVYAAKIHATDPIRIVRALEVLALTGEPISAHHGRHAVLADRYRARRLVLDVPTNVVRERIAARSETMLARGWVDEVRAILADGYARDAKPLQSVGYAQVVANVLGHATLDDTLASVRRETVAFARRQRTWFRGERTMEWVRPEVLLGDEFVAGLREHMGRQG